MQDRCRIPQNLCCLAVGLFTLAASYSRANAAEVDWTFDGGFAPTSIAVNTGDEVDFVNLDPDFDVVVSGNPPESFTVDIPPGYYYPYVYNNQGTFTASDNYGDPDVTITVNPIVTTPLSVAITAPTNNSAFSFPATFNITAVPSGGATPYSDVEFLVGTNDIADVTSSPFTATATNLPVGNFTISAIVIDNNLNTATNSILVDVLPPPSLTATRAGNQIVVSWPTNNPTPTSLSLETSTNLGPSASWTPVTQAPAAVGDKWTVTNPVSGARMFFRLSSQ